MYFGGINFSCYLIFRISLKWKIFGVMNCLNQVWSKSFDVD